MRQFVAAVNRIGIRFGVWLGTSWFDGSHEEVIELEAAR